MILSKTVWSWTRRFMLVTALLLLVIGCTQKEEQLNQAPDAAPSEQTVPSKNDESSQPDNQPAPKPIVQEPEKPKPYTLEARLVAVGDVMMHSPQIPAAYDAKTDTYSFDSYFTHVKDKLQGDWVVANLETPLAGEELGGYSGYPMFNAPESLADALRDAGVNIVSTANNHSLDRREQGLLNTLATVKERGLLPVGTYESAEAAQQLAIVEKNGIRMAFLAYTYGTNGIPIPEGKDYLVNLLDEEKMKADISRARTEADVVTVSLHFGHEYHRQPSEEQKALSEALIAAGADIILGSHPHVVQPYETIETTTEAGVPRQGVVIYSLGNFISNQGPDQGTAKYTDVGVIFQVTVKKHMPEGVLELTVEEPTSTWVHKYYDGGKRQYRILPIEAVLASKNDPILSESHYNLLGGYLTEMDQHLASMAVPVSAE